MQGLTSKPYAYFITFLSVDQRRKIIHFNISGTNNNFFQNKPLEIIERLKKYFNDIHKNIVFCILPSCPRCSTSPDLFKRHELRNRQFYVIVDEVVNIVKGILIRWKCSGCNKTFTQYPDFALPYKRYVLQSIMEYAERYIEIEEMTYAQLLRVWAAGYQQHENDESHLWPSTIHRWITTLSGMSRLIQKAQGLIHKKNPSVGVTRHLAQLNVSDQKYRSERRKKLLVACCRLLHLEKIYLQTFSISIFPQLATACFFK